MTATACKPRKRPAPTPELPESHLERADALGFRTISYLNTAREVRYTYGTRSEWLPRDLIAKDGLSSVIYRKAGDGDYAIDGWEPEHDGMHGGRRADILSALAWVERARAVRAGTAKDFFGA